MRSYRARIAVCVGTAVVIVGLWINFSPTKLGGSTTYAITDGISMQPLLHAGDLAIIRVQPSYRVGEVVLYQSQILHKPVLHRIILIQNGNYFFKGDHNGFVDPGYATRSELIGELWFFVPSIGTPLTWFAKPLHSGLLAGAAALLLVLVGLHAPTRNRRKRRGSSHAAAPMTYRVSEGEAGSSSRERRSSGETGDPRAASGTHGPGHDRRSGIEMTTQQVATRHAPPYFEGPLWFLAILGVSIGLAILLLGLGFSRPSQRAVPLTSAYRQSGVFSYSAQVKAPTEAYPSGTVTTGQPIYSNLVSTVTLRFDYRFASSLPHHVKGTIALHGLVLSNTDTWQEFSTIKTAASFDGDRSSLVSTVALSGLYGLINTVSADSGVTGTTYSADIQPVVQIVGTVDGQPIHETFAPVLPFDVGPTSIVLAPAVAAPLPGATYIAPSASSVLSATLNPGKPGSVPQLVANVISVARYQIEVPTLRIMGFIFAGLAVIMALLHEILRRRKTMRSSEEVVAARMHTLLVPVTSLRLPDDSSQIEIPDFAHLAGLAQFLERPILYDWSDDRRTYTVVDEAMHYVYRPLDGGTHPDLLRATV